MKKHQHSMPFRPGDRVFVKAHATLDVEGWDKSEIWIETDLNVQRIQHESDGLHLVFIDDATIRLPSQSLLTIERAAGNARVRSIAGEVEIRTIEGNLAVQNANRVRVERVNGNCLFQNIGGEMEIRTIAGTLKGKDFLGRVLVDRVMGSADLSALHGGADVRSSGDIHVGFLTDTDAAVRLRSSGEITMNLPFGLDAEMRIRTDARLTELSIGERREKITHRKHTLLVGDGRRKFDLEAGGKIQIVAEKIEDREILKLFDELESLWEELGKENQARREARAANGAPAANAGEDSDLTQEEMRAAEQRVQSALKQVENTLQSLGYEPKTNPPAAGPVYGDIPVDLTGERMIIMRLVSEKKISLEEADKLLEALER